MKNIKRITVIGLIFLGFFVLGLPLFGGGNKEVPEIPPITSGVQYLSPNGDGVKDSAELDFTVKIVVKSNEGYIPEYGLQIISQDGTVIRQVIEREKSDIGWFRSLFRGYEEFTLTKKIAWDGKDAQGSVVPDGNYMVRMWVMDSSKNRKEIELDDFVVDTIPPKAEVTPPDPKVFSPDGDGFQDTIIFVQTGGSEALWQASITGPSGPVRTYRFENSAPRNVEWDGRDNSGDLVSDGVYTYVLQGTDLAGNKSPEYKVEGIIVDTRKREVGIMADPLFFSPVAKDAKQTVSFYPVIPKGEQISVWSIEIKNPEGNVLFSETGEGAPPESWEFSGRYDSGQPLEEGAYNALFKVRFINGMSVSDTAEAVLDLTPPQIALKVNNPVFSPDADGVKDNIEISLFADEPVFFDGVIIDADGTVLAACASDGPALEKGATLWDGKDGDGNTVSDGEYTIEAVFTDRAGNSVVGVWFPLIIDTKDVAVGLQVPEYYSPGQGRVPEALRIGVEATEYVRVESWELTIADPAGKPIRVLNGEETLPENIAWDGVSGTDRSRAPDGKYKASLRVVYDKGKTATAVSEQFILDATPPAVEVAFKEKPFIRDAGKVMGEGSLLLSAKDDNGIASWNIEAYDQMGQRVKQVSGTGNPPGEFVWNSEEEEDFVLREGRYEIRVTVQDRAKNETDRRFVLESKPIAELRQGKLKLLVRDVIFAAYKDTLDSAGAEMLRINRESLAEVVRILNRFPEYSILLEGHALNIYVSDRTKFQQEERILLPLTERRAAAVLKALTDAGIDKNRISAKAFGGRQPNASVTDKSVWWQIRRVEFYLVGPKE